MTIVRHHYFLLASQVNLLDRSALEGVFDDFEFDSCVHFAGLKAVGESVAKPLLYYRCVLRMFVWLFSFLY